MYKKPQMRVVNNAPMKVEQINKPVGIRPTKNVLWMKQIKPKVPPVSPGNFQVPYKLQVSVEDHCHGHPQKLNS
jgi:hypothetical protein